MTRSPSKNGNGKHRPAVSSEILDRSPPYELEAETALLGSLLLDRRMVDEVADSVSAEDFYDDSNRIIFRHISAIHQAGNPVDVISLGTAMKTAGDFERVGGSAFLARTAQSVPNAAHAKYYARIVRDTAVKRSLLDTGTEIIRSAYDDGETDEILSNAEQSILAIRDRRTDATHTTSARDVMHKALSNLEARKAGKLSGIPTGFSAFDEIVGGLRGSEVLIFAARTSMGKSAFVLNVLEYVAIALRVPTLFCSLEMSADEIGDRLLASQARVDLHAITHGRYSPDESARMVEASGHIAGAPFSIDDAPARSLSSIAALARRHKRKSGLGLLIIDYLQLIVPESRRDTRQEEVAEISRRIKALARELNVPVICLAQLNRQTETSQDNRPKLSHLRESGAIEQDANIVAFIHRPGYFSDRQTPATQPQDAEIIIAKHRGGRTGIARLVWFGAFVRFDNPAGTSF